jgi:5-oxopent-3-ene-1,2,5-tricarboxylate decarboxylase/2-hydroxyhepta-2,4-diene-1,7-dioate isomerase
MKRVRFEIGGRLGTGVLGESGIIQAESGERLDPTQVRFLAPATPSKILCIGVNYEDALEALGLPAPAEPLIRVLKPPSCLAGHREPIVKPSWARRLFFEGELGVVIGRQCRNVKAEDAYRVVAGYAPFNDLGVRDFPPPTSADHSGLVMAFAQLVKAKSSDTFGPMGPALENEVDPSDLHIRTLVNGEVRQDSRTSRMVFKIPELIEYITAFMTLEPGDVLVSGTPAGAGPVEPGDVVRVEIEGVGVLENPVVAGA